MFIEEIAVVKDNKTGRVWFRCPECGARCARRDHRSRGGRSVYTLVCRSKTCGVVLGRWRSATARDAECGAVLKDARLGLGCQGKGFPRNLSSEIAIE